MLGSDRIAETKAPEAVEAWLRHFEAGWRNPGGPAAFTAHFEPVLHPEVRMLQPQLPTIVGVEEFRRGFAEPTFALFPDLRGEVEHWATDGERLYVELRLQATVGGAPVSWITCDRITLRDGLATERVAYFDAGPLLKAFALHPRAWPRFARSQLLQLRFRLGRRRRG
jgi:ketosteroid isomerase-like protein